MGLPTPKRLPTPGAVKQWDPVLAWLGAGLASTCLLVLIGGAAFLYGQSSRSGIAIREAPMWVGGPRVAASPDSEPDRGEALAPVSDPVTAVTALVSELRDQRAALAQERRDLQAMLQTLASSKTLGGPMDHSPAPTSAPLPCEDPSSLEAAKDDGARLAWVPQEDRFLVATCVQGRASNRLRCFHKYILAATLLNRTLVLPIDDLKPRSGPWIAAPPGVDPHDKFGLVLNASHLRACLGPGTALDFTEFLRATKTKSLHVDRLLCWPKACMFPGGQPISHPRLKLPPLEQSPAGDRLSMAEFVAAFGGVGERHLCLGDLDYAHFTDPPRDFGLGLSSGWTSGPLTNATNPHGRECRVLLRPHQALIEAAEGFVRVFTGGRFAAAHVRRTDLYRYCHVYGHCSFRPVRQLAACLRRQLAAAGLAVLFLATDAPPEEANFLTRLLQAPPEPPGRPPGGGGGPNSSSLLPTPGFSSPPATVVRLPPLGNNMWAMRVHNMGLEESPLAAATVEKLVCVLAELFLGTPGSSFTEHIRGLRRGRLAPTCRDGPVCAASIPQEPVPTWRRRRRRRQ